MRAALSAEGGIREYQPGAGQSSLPLLLDAHGYCIEGCLRLNLIHGIRRIAQREGEDHVALRAGAEVHVVDERGGRESLLTGR